MKRLLLPLFACALLVGCGAKDEPAPTPTPSPAPTPVVEKRAVPEFDGTLLSGMHTVVLKTTKGDITLELNADAAPATVTNFVTLAKAGYYDGLLFHRVIPDFMIQAGDPNGSGTGGESIYGEKFKDEINAESYGLNTQKLSDISGGQPLPDELKDATVQKYYEMQGYVYNTDLESLPMEKGSLAMANRGANTNGSQFFIIQREGGTPWLEGKHTVFGKVVSGLEIVDAIATVERDSRDKPLEAITYTVEVQ